MNESPKPTPNDRKKRLTPQQQAARDRVVAIDQRNRRLLIGTGIIAPIAVAGTLIAKKILSEQEPQTDEAWIQNGAAQIIVQEKPLEPNTQEIETWKKRAFQPISENLSEEKTKEEAKKRVQQTIELMGMSLNPYFKTAHNLLKQLEKQDRLRVIYERSLDHVQKDGFMLAEAQENNGKLYNVLGVSSSLVNRANFPMIIALFLTHEIRHIANFNEFENKLKQNNPYISPQEILAQDKKRISDKGKVLEEARAYAEEARAYIYQYGLGEKSGNKTFFEKFAARFVEYGQKEDDPRWLQYISGII